MAAKRPLFSFVTVLLFLLAIPPAKLNANEITECNCIKRDDTPTRQQLTLMVVPDLNATLQIKDRISDYDTLGTFLLSDMKGVTLDRIRQDFRLTKQIIDEIFDLWIRGEGQKPNTWGMLVKNLRYSKLHALADEIESILELCTIESMHLECKIVNAEHAYTDYTELVLASAVTVTVVIGTTVIVIVVYFKPRDSKYTAYLKRRYKPKKRDSSIDGKDTWPFVHITKVFRLALIKYKDVDRIAKETGDCDLKQGKKTNSTTEIELKDVFKGVEERKVLIEGVAGSGKSTLCLHLCRQWQEGKMFQEYRYVVLVKLREKSVQQAKRIADILPKENKSMGLEAEKEITECNGNGVLFIFDGWDELSQETGHRLFLDIVTGEKLAESSVLVMSRPISTLDLQHSVSSRIEILRFEKSELRNFLAHYLNNDSNYSIKLNALLDENPVLESFFCLPLNAIILVHLVKFQTRCGYGLPTTEYEIFREFVLCLIVRHQRKSGKKGFTLTSLDDLPDDIETDFNYLCKVAYDGAKRGIIVFDQEYFRDKLIQNDDQRDILGLFLRVESFAIRGNSVSYNFIHLAIQELLSAIYLATQVKASEQKIKFNELFGQPRFTGVFRYYAAHTKLKTPGIENIVIRAVTDHARATRLISDGSDTASQDFTFDYAPQPLLLSVIHCLFYAEDDHLYQTIAKQLDKKLDLSFITLNPADCMSVGAFLAYCEQLQMYSCHIGNDGCKMLFRKNRRYPFRMLVLSGNSIGDEGAVAISEVMKTMTNLQKLNLGINSIGDEGAVAISEAMKTMTNLSQFLSLQYNSIGDKGAVAISEAIKTMTNLKTLYLQHNDAITEVGREALKEAAKLSGTKIYL